MKLCTWEFFFPAESLYRDIYMQHMGQDYNPWGCLAFTSVVRREILSFRPKFVMLPVVNSIKRKFRKNWLTLHLGVFFPSWKPLQRHFHAAHGTRLQSSRMFGIHISSKERDIVFPAKVCYVISGQLYKKKVPQELTPRVVKLSMRWPKERLQTIEQGQGDQMQAPVSKDWEQFIICDYSNWKLYRYSHTSHRRFCRMPACK